MATAPSSSQQPQSFHPDYDQEVFMIVFSVEGQGFKVDAARLTHHSQFLRDMLCDGSGNLGLTKEGSLEYPIVVHGCSRETFANFLGWLNHDAWKPLKAERTKQLLDILHVSHMWDIVPGVEFATTELLSKADLHPAHRLHLARQYRLLDWIEVPVRMLLTAPLERYTAESQETLDFKLYMVITTTKESIAKARKVLANHPPFPANSDNAPFCLQHDNCKKVWTEKWFLSLARRIHHPSENFPLISIPSTLKTIDHQGMNAECKKYIIEWIDGTFSYLIRKEEDLILEAVATPESGHISGLYKFLQDLRSQASDFRKWLSTDTCATNPPWVCV
ncbi:hypothetical protein M413DRAFT_30043 [Hebeloma cylindrosporum]|uniref:BTB domain-containing protein n=1 Tax=Hebeloma cylindrosporum TaxID=76867 RepID=A0A0C2XL72_HEBCY|nr:hypothetical protein M413DRAFT_30043 [Hebeloma cylindrosporum h7]